ncbi:MAG: conjugal transfer protein TraD [Thiolinea sp.]
MTNAEWLQQRIEYIKGLNKPTAQQELLLLLNNKSNKTAVDDRKLAAVVKAERADEKAQQAKADVKRIMNAEKRAARKARDRELYNTAGLLIVAGLVDTKTGKPTIDKAELVGALASLAKLPEQHEKRSEWKQEGTRLLDERA